MATTTTTPEAILSAVGGPENIVHLTHCATRLRFELHDASGIDKAEVEAIPGVLGAVPQSGDRYQIVIGGAVQGVYTQIMNLPAMASKATPSDADVKAAQRAKAKGKSAIVDAFFEYLSDSFRPLLPVLLGTSLIIAGEAVLEAFGLIDTRAENLPPTLIFANAMFKSVFYFMPIMVAYNASKKLDIDPWVGTAIMAALVTPDFISLSSPDTMGTTCTHNALLAKDLCSTHIAGIPMQLNDYGGQVFVPLLMVAILAPLYKFFTKLIPSNVQMVFVPFLSFIVMMPLTAFVIGPIGIWLGTGLGTGLFWLYTHAPFVFALFIPMLYPFLVPLGLHWPLNAIMIANINGEATNHLDYIQGPMGAWNFACFGATAAVLAISWRGKDMAMRQTSMGALAAGLFGGIAEPSLYGIHLRFKRIYPMMLVGCFAGGLVQAIGGIILGHGVTTGAFAFTSLLTISVFKPTTLYGLSIAVAFATSFFLIFTFDYRTKEEREAAGAAVEASAADTAADLALEAKADEDSADKEDTPQALVPGTVTTITSPLAGTTMPLGEVPDPVFSTGAVGDGAGVNPSGDIVVTAPADATVVVAPASGHAYGLKLDNGVEILVHVGIDTVNLEGKGFDVKVKQGDQVRAGQTLVTVDRAVVEEAGYSPITPVLVTNTAAFKSVEIATGGEVAAGAPLLKVTA